MHLLTRRQKLKNYGIAVIIALTGFVSLFITVSALLLGLWVDSRLGLRGPATICILTASVPLSLWVMIRMALGLVRKLPPPNLPKPKQDLQHHHKEE